LKKLLNDFLGCKFKRRAISFYEAASRKLNGYKDFLKIITLLKEFRQLKKIYFNGTQYTLFKRHNKQEVTIEEDSEEKVKGEVKYFDLYKAYLKGSEKAKESKAYKRLLRNFDQNLCCIFDKISEQN
jgi:hypothetical protein